MGINKVILIGNVGKDPEVRHLEGGASVATLTLATTERYKDRNSGETREVTEWHNVVVWRQLADLAERFIRKGTQIYVEGKLRSRSWDDQNGQKHYTTEVVADTVQLLGRRSDNQGAGSPYDAQAQGASRQGLYQGQQNFNQGTQSYRQPQGYAQAPSSGPQPPVAALHPQTTPAISPEELNDDGNDDLPF